MKLTDKTLRECAAGRSIIGFATEQEAYRQLLAARKALRATQAWFRADNRPMHDTPRHRLRMAVQRTIAAALKQPQEPPR